MLTGGIHHDELHFKHRASAFTSVSGGALEARDGLDAGQDSARLPEAVRPLPAQHADRPLLRSRLRLGPYHLLLPHGEEGWWQDQPEDAKV